MSIKLSDLVNRNKLEKPVVNTEEIQQITRHMKNEEFKILGNTVKGIIVDEVKEKSSGIKLEVNPKKDEPLAEISEEALAKEFQHEDQPDNFNEKEIKTLRENLNMLRDNLSNPEIVGQAIPRIMAHLQKHDFLVDMMLPEDCGLMVKGLRESYGVIIAKKNEKTKKKAVKEKQLDEIEGLIAGFNVEI